ncbi:MAG: hypothetical protein GY861_14010 [bacterium]|nr:hypothetical protein [bacterium]
MTTVENYVKNGVLKPYWELQIKRLQGGAYEASWVTITRYLLQKGQAKIKRKLDVSEYGFGNFSVSNAKFKIDNSGGIFFPPNIQNSLFFGYDSRQYTKVRYEAGYIDTDGSRIEEKVFEGFVSEKTIKTDIMKGTCTFTAVSYDGILQDRKTGASQFSASLTVTQVAASLFTDTEVLKYLGYDGGKINPKLNSTIDVTTEYNGKTVKDVLDDVCNRGNSVWYIDDAFDLVIQARQPNAGTPYAFVGGNTKNKEVNIIDRFDYDEGYKNIINYVTWKEGSTESVFSADSSNLATYGTNDIEISGEDITTYATKEAIANNIIDDNKAPLRRITIRTMYMPNFFNLFDTATIDWNGSPITSDVFIWNLQDWNDNKYYLTLASGFNLDTTTKWMILGWEYATGDSTMDIYLVETGL